MKQPVVYIEGDGIGPFVMKAARFVVDGVVGIVYSDRKIEWREALAGKKALEATGQPLPEETLKMIESTGVAIKGPLETPVGTGYRSLNVQIRQNLDLFACIRPVKWIRGIPSVVKNPELLDVVIFRENTEDVYAGIEWDAFSSEAAHVRSFLKKQFGIEIPQDSGIGLKPISERATKRIMRAAVRHAIQNNRKSVTIVHKGNIMKHTEGAFRKWCYEVAKEEFRGFVRFEDEAEDGRILVNDRIADDMFQQLLLFPEQYDVIVTTNLNGDYLSDACAAQVGGIGVAPSANVGEICAVFEPTHGTAPRLKHPEYANPLSLILSSAMMLEYIGWKDAASLLRKSAEKVVEEGVVTPDLAEKTGRRGVSAMEFAHRIVEEAKVLWKR
ncbi:MAG: isocitrate dehydrogenase [Thermotogota bacterium]|nr:isocitrate dehydrogenase [Thermotogota bacterium]MDK2865414.1 isocitrate dehydrogenase [Thermotogota bacterium]